MLMWSIVNCKLNERKWNLPELSNYIWIGLCKEGGEFRFIQLILKFALLVELQSRQLMLLSTQGNGWRQCKYLKSCQSVLKFRNTIRRSLNIMRTSESMRSVWVWQIVCDVISVARHETKEEFHTIQDFMRHRSVAFSTLLVPAFTVTVISMLFVSVSFQSNCSPLMCIDTRVVKCRLSCKTNLKL